MAYLINEIMYVTNDISDVSAFIGINKHLTLYTMYLCSNYIRVAIANGWENIYMYNKTTLERIFCCYVRNAEECLI